MFADGLKNHHSEPKFSALLQFCKWLKGPHFLSAAEKVVMAQSLPWDRFGFDGLREIAAPDR
jgi:hypothetical protein